MIGKETHREKERVTDRKKETQRERERDTKKPGSKELIGKGTETERERKRLEGVRDRERE